MKKYPILLLVLMGFFLPRLSFTQTELSAGLRLQVQAPVVHWLHFGQGSGASAWVALPLSTQGSLEFSLGYQHFSGYQRGLVTINEVINPYEYWRSTHNTQLNGMTFFSTDVGYAFRLPDNRWSASVGVRIARIIDAEGFRQTHKQNRSYRIETARIADLFNVDIDQSFQSGSGSFSTSTLNEAQLNLYDFGLTMALRYNLFKGLMAEAGIYQGFLNRWSADYSDLQALYVTSFSIGLSARIF